MICFCNIKLQNVLWTVRGWGGGEELFVKLKSVRKLGNFNFQWTKTLYQNNFKDIAFFFTLFKGYKCTKL